MRYYDCTITNPDGSVYRRWASHTNGVFDPGALNVEFDIITADYSVPSGAQSFQIEGISLSDLTNASDFTPQNPDSPGTIDPAKQKTFTLLGGMKKGLPLANPAQAGMIAQGIVFQSFGNWQGTEMALNFVIIPSLFNYYNPGNIVLNWKSGTPLADAISNMLTTAYPSLPAPTINISPSRINNYDVTHFATSMEDVSAKISDHTAGVLSPGDQGVKIVLQNGAFLVTDQIYTPSVVQLNFTDLIGQPTWIDVKTIIFKLVLRGDIKLGSFVQLPAKMQSAPGMALTSAESFPSNVKYTTFFNGVFRVNECRQVGNYRSSDGAAWVTILKCTPVNA